jgi:colanic acid/amylovoran biosynthesis glycosyltransferase
MPIQVIVLLDSFPALSETFLYNTILNWQKAGMNVSLLARKRGQTVHEIPFQSQVRYLPSESLPTPLKFLIVLWFFLKLCFHPAKLKTAWKCVQYGDRFRGKLQLAFRLFPLIHRQTGLMYFPFGGLAVKYLEYILETESRVVFSLRGSDIHIEPLQSSSYRERLQKALIAADGVHCVCSEIKERAEVLNGSPLPNARVIRTALASEFLTTDFPRKIKTSVDNMLEIVSVGRLDWGKGFEHGIVAAQALMQRGIDFRWRIIGDGEYRLPLQWAIRDMGLQERVFLAGALKHHEVVQALRSADIFFHPSIHEGISNAVLEAMALGLPLVGSDVGGMREAIPSDEYGLLIPARNWMSMADALEKLAGDAQLRAQIGKSASAFVRSRFTTEEQIAGFLSLFRKVLDRETARCA